MSPGKPRVVDNMHSSMAYQTDVVNKQLVPPLSLNNPFSNIY